VYLATQQSFDRKVALKIIANTSFGGDEQALRFNREAKIIAGLSHPHIVPVYDVGSIDQYQYLAMDYLPNGELNALIKAGLEPQESVVIISQIAQALHFAHNKGYIHRDVKPDNILFREDLSAVLTDFGIARSSEQDQDHGLTQHGKVIGTPSYMSPEQSQNKTLNGRTDLYALGVIFYLMLTRELPFKDNDSMALAIKHIKDPIPQLPKALQAYQIFINKLLAKDPQDRYSSGLELVKALKSIDYGSAGNSAHHSSKNSNEPLDQLTITSQSHQTAAPIKSLVINELSYRKMGILKRYRFHASVSSNEHQHLSILFSQLTTQLMEWRIAHEKDSGQVALDFYLPQKMKAQAQALVDNLLDQDSPFTFLNKLDLSIVYHS
ncbi:MAG: serine/threonine-protein kinase PpkA, partial [Pseudohongiellaceae bacterium]